MFFKFKIINSPINFPFRSVLFRSVNILSFLLFIKPRIFTVQIDKIGKRKAPDDEYEPYEERTRLNQQESMIPKKKSRNETNDNFTSTFFHIENHEFPKY